MIASGLTTSYRLAQLDGLHLPDHEYRLALFVGDSIAVDTPAYTPAGEAKGLGYTPGGQVLEGRAVNLQGNAVTLGWEPCVFDPATVTADGALIYNASLPGMPSVAVIGFAQRTASTNGPFVVPLEEIVVWTSGEMPEMELEPDVDLEPQPFDEPEFEPEMDMEPAMEPQSAVGPEIDYTNMR